MIGTWSVGQGTVTNEEFMRLATERYDLVRALVRSRDEGTGIADAESAIYEFDLAVSFRFGMTERQYFYDACTVFAALKRGEKVDWARYHTGDNPHVTCLADIRSRQLHGERWRVEVYREQAGSDEALTDFLRAYAVYTNAEAA